MNNRRDFLKVCAVGVVALPLASTTKANAVAGSKPNIIIVLADDLGYGDLGCFGQKFINTPNLDQMAKEGKKLTQHYSGNTVCAPSRSALLTGLHMGHTYVRGNGSIEVRPDPDDIILARILKNAGYHTAMIGKSGLACNSQNGELANQKGFDFFFGFTSHTDAHWYYPPYLWRNNEKVMYPNNKRHEGDQYSHDVCVDEVLKYIQQRSREDQPFFLHVALQIPHASIVVPEDSVKPYLGRFEEKPYLPKNPHYSRVKNPTATYAGMVSRMDRDMGKMLKLLRDVGIAENTLVIFSSDNGPAVEGGYHRDNLNSNGPLRGGKRDMYEGGIRVPTIAWWPSKIKPDTTSDHISAFWDYMPTCCELAGIDPPKNIDGISFVPMLLGKKQKPHEYLYWEFHEQGKKQAIRMGKWKAVRLKLAGNPDAPMELYNLEKDLGEENNIAAEHPEVVQMLAEKFKSARTDSELFDLFAGGKNRNNQKRLSKKNLIPNKDWKLVRVDSESKFNGKVAANAFDGNPESIWHTQWNGAQPGHPHELVIDLGKEYSIQGLRYLPRNDGQTNGAIKDFELFISDVSDDFSKSVLKSKFKKGVNEQEKKFKTTRGRFVLLRTLSEQTEQPYASIAELGFIGKP